MKSPDERIAEALKQPIETPDMTDFVMARLPIKKRWRLRWAYAVAIPIAILAVVLFLNRGQKPEYQATKRPAPVSPAPVEKPIPRPMPNPQRFVVQEPQEKRPAVRRHISVPKHTRPVPQTPRTRNLPSLAEMPIPNLAVSRPDTPSLPPNEEAATTERPALGVIANCGPEQIPVEELGG